MEVTLSSLEEAWNTNVTLTDAHFYVLLHTVLSILASIRKCHLSQLWVLLAKAFAGARD